MTCLVSILNEIDCDQKLLLAVRIVLSVDLQKVFKRSDNHLHIWWMAHLPCSSRQTTNWLLTKRISCTELFLFILDSLVKAFLALLRHSRVEADRIDRNISWACCK